MASLLLTNKFRCVVRGIDFTESRKRFASAKYPIYSQTFGNGQERVLGTICSGIANLCSVTSVTCSSKLDSCRFGSSMAVGGHWIKILRK